MSMRISVLQLFVLLMASCSANAQQPLALIGHNLPTIRHVTEMKVVGDTLWFVYETEDGLGQRFLRKAVIDSEKNTLDVGPVIGKKSDGYYMAYMPYPVNGIDSGMQVVNQEDGEIFGCESDSVLTRTKNYILSGNSTVPFAISRYVQDISSVYHDNYVLIGREPNGGEQYAMKANIATAEVDTIRKISLSPQLTTWLPNAGELVYSKLHDRLAFAYRLHPVIEIFGMDGKLIKQVRIGEDTFNPSTLEEADFEDLNPLQFVDLSVTTDCIYALHWNFKNFAARLHVPMILKIDWNGNIVGRYSAICQPLYKIAATADYVIGWTGEKFVRIDL